eukprot:jgi/Orpsp1_1/1181473/evm.model.c7180000077305.1
MQPYNVYQNMAESFILNPFFLWVFLILLYNRKNWKRPIILLLIFHWVFRSVGDLLNYRASFIPWAPNTYWPYTDQGWLMAQAIPNIFWLTSEILGDWYPLLRTKAVTKQNKKIIFVFITCILYNIVKLYSMYALFGDLPIDFRLTDDDGNKVRDIARIKIRYWSTVLALQVASFLYDLSVIVCLRKNLFNKLKEYQNFSENTFLYKFRQISELRIIFSMIASMIFLPFIIGFVVYLVNVYKKEGTGSIVASDEPVDAIRRAVLSINYTLMYIDQILLKNITERNASNLGYNSSSKKTFGANSSNSTYKSQIKTSSENLTAVMSTSPTTPTKMSFGSVNTSVNMSINSINMNKITFSNTTPQMTYRNNNANMYNYSRKASYEINMEYNNPRSPTETSTSETLYNESVASYKSYNGKPKNYSPTSNYSNQRLFMNDHNESSQYYYNLQNMDNDYRRIPIDEVPMIKKEEARRNNYHF